MTDKHGWPRVWRFCRSLFGTMPLCAAALLHSSAALGAVTPSLPAASPQPVPATSAPAVAAPKPPQGVTYSAGQLSVDLTNVTLAEVLTRIAAATGAKIEVPPEANGESMPVVKAGPGLPRDIVAALLRDSHLFYLIQASDADPEKIQSILVMPADKKGNEAVDASVPRSQPAFARARPGVRVEEAPADSSPVPVIPEKQVADANSQEPEVPQIPSGQLTASAPIVSPELNVPKVAPVPPPAVMNEQNISQQLQEMYQQRVQMLQQDRQAAAVAPATPQSH